MTENEFNSLLNEKLSLVTKLYELTRGQNSCIKAGEYNRAAELDGQKPQFLKRIMEIAPKLSGFSGKKRAWDKTAEDTIQKLNLLLNDLISIEKENESMISDAEKSLSGTYIESYKNLK